MDLDEKSYRAQLGLAEVALNDGKLAHVIHHYNDAWRIAPDKATARLAQREADYYARLNNDEDVCLALLEEHYVATVHGAAYYMSPYLRISTATADAELLEGLKRIQVFCEGLR